MARVRTNIRRQTAMNEPDAGRKEGMIQAGSITVDTVGLQIFKNGVPVEVTQREYALLLFLAGSVGTVFSREILMQKVWNYDYWGDTRSVDVAVRRLREKLEDDPANPTLLCTRRGAGYYLSGN
jgi:Response regulators consisting of a CheY-like receiver domain and a winged-helix DNA-binding domain